MRTSRGSHPGIEAKRKKGHIPQAAVVPVRRREEEVEVCLVTSLGKKKWILPKGINDPGESLEQTALKEAFEEAGLKGRIVGEPIGRFEDEKWGSVLDVSVFIMEVDEALDKWQESHLRRRKFVPLEEARGMVKKKILRKMLKRASKRLAQTK